MTTDPVSMPAERETRRMDGPLRTYDPLFVLKPVAPDVWIVDGPLIQFDYLGLAFPFTTRMTVIRLADGGLWVHSPIAITPDLQAAIAALGPVRFLVAPNTLHYAEMPAWQAAFPQARSFGPPSAAERARRHGVDLRLDAHLTDATEGAWAGAIDQALISGRILTEAAFFHRSSRTLILTDLIENFEADHIANRFYRTLVRWSGAMDPDGKAPLDMQLSFLFSRRALRGAVGRLIGWDPERVLLAHGRWYDRDGSAELRRAFRWLGRF